MTEPTSDRSGILDLGDGRTFTPVWYDGAIIGYYERHPKATNPGETCVGFVGIARPEADKILTLQSPKWSVISWDPLHLEPSIRCRACGNHGFVRGGKWEPA